MSTTDHLQLGERILRGIPLAVAFGMELEHIGERDARMALTVTSNQLNYLGQLHGGVLAALMDTVAFFPAILVPSGRRFTTTNVNVAFYRAVEPGTRVVAIAEVSHAGKRTAHVDVVVRDPGTKCIARAQVSLLDIS